MTSFWDLTDDEIRTGLDMMHDSAVRFAVEMNGSSWAEHLLPFAFDSQWQELAMMWVACEGDRTLMKLRFADEIAAMRGQQGAIGAHANTGPMHMAYSGPTGYSNT